jgi:hypothetical protein
VEQNFAACCSQKGKCEKAQYFAIFHDRGPGEESRDYHTVFAGRHARQHIRGRSADEPDKLFLWLST